MAVLSLDRLSKRFGARLAVDAVSFEVQEREVFGLLGPNGSGKSTILRLVTGYLYPSSGTVRIAGIDVVRAARAARERIGYVPEDSPLYGHMRVVEYLGFMGRLRGITGRALDRAIDAAVERLALGSVRNVIIERLSRGYRQRVSLAQAVLHKPELLVLDEPSNGLDPAADHRIARPAQGPGAGLRRAGDVPHPGRDRAHGRPGGHPARRAAPDRRADRP